MQIYDTHAHLDHLESLDQALSIAAEKGVVGIVAISMDLNSSKEVLNIKEKYSKPKIYIGMGMHPSETNEHDLDELLVLIDQHKDDLHVVGEIGLDFWYKWVRKDEAKKDEQRRVYRRLLEVAKELDIPAVIHSRGAWQECLDIALDVGVTKAEFHWYSGPLDVLDGIIDSGYYVSTSPSVAYSPQSREAMAHAPIERTLIETDSPVYYKDRNTNEGFKSEPVHVFKTLSAYSKLKNMSEEEAVQILNKNAEEFFNLN